MEVSPLESLKNDSQCQNSCFCCDLITQTLTLALSSTRFHPPTFSIAHMDFPSPAFQMTHENDNCYPCEVLDVVEWQ